MYGNKFVPAGETILKHGYRFNSLENLMLNHWFTILNHRFTILNQWFTTLKHWFRIIPQAGIFYFKAF